jgi:hypothetical protein
MKHVIIKSANDAYNGCGNGLRIYICTRQKIIIIIIYLLQGEELRRGENMKLENRKMRLFFMHRHRYGYCDKARPIVNLFITRKA